MTGNLGYSRHAVRDFYSAGLTSPSPTRWGEFWQIHPHTHTQKDEIMAREMSNILTDVADISADYDETAGENVRDIGPQLYELLTEMAEWVIANTTERPTT